MESETNIDSANAANGSSTAYNIAADNASAAIMYILSIIYIFIISEYVIMNIAVIIAMNDIPTIVDMTCCLHSC